MTNISTQTYFLQIAALDYIKNELHRAENPEQTQPLTLLGISYKPTYIKPFDKLLILCLNKAWELATYTSAKTPVSRRTVTWIQNHLSDLSLIITIEQLFLTIIMNTKFNTL